MSLSVLLPVMLIILTGACVQSALGFGATMVTMGFLPLLMDYGKALGLSIALVTISTAYISVKYRKQIQWKIMLPFLIPTAVICGIVILAKRAGKAPGLISLLYGLCLIGYDCWFFRAMMLFFAS